METAVIVSSFHLLHTVFQLFEKHRKIEHLRPKNEQKRLIFEQKARKIEQLIEQNEQLNEQIEHLR